MQGSARILHITDVHGQLKPVYFREPNVNLGVGDAFGRPPHLVGKKLLEANALSDNTPESYAYTYLGFDKAAHTYGKTGGFAAVLPTSRPCLITCAIRPAASRTR
jgi:sulfur-oxidizing protein SoxB